VRRNGSFPTVKSLVLARGVYKGRKANIDPVKIKKMKTDGMGPVRDCQDAQDWQGVGLSRASGMAKLDQATLAGTFGVTHPGEGKNFDWDHLGRLLAGTRRVDA
jgi:hypothetical protein